MIPEKCPVASFIVGVLVANERNVLALLEPGAETGKCRLRVGAVLEVFPIPVGVADVLPRTVVRRGVLDSPMDQRSLDRRAVPAFGHSRLRSGFAWHAIPELRETVDTLPPGSFIDVPFDDREILEVLVEDFPTFHGQRRRTIILLDPDGLT